MTGSEGYAAASAVSVGARKVLLEDVLLVAVQKARVDLHPASLEKACPCAPSGKKGGGGDEVFDIRCLLQCVPCVLICAVRHMCECVPDLENFGLWLLSLVCTGQCCIIWLLLTTGIFPHVLDSFMEAAVVRVIYKQSRWYGEYRSPSNWVCFACSQGELVVFATP